jgi:iron complex outermembrane receptor protein
MRASPAELGGLLFLLEALKIRDLSNLSVGIPNVAMDDIGTFRSIANFSIRGLGINSSIPSIDPTVGVFIDGVYMGQPAGIVIDMFDIQSIEVLRGPQGTLFGRNVTGGAVLINTKKPGDELEFTVRAALDGNPNGDGGLTSYIMGAVGGPISDTFGARLSIYHTGTNPFSPTTIWAGSWPRICSMPALITELRAVAGSFPSTAGTC